ncbi:hypothetical protein HAZT_HAZT001283 [Hyalella azteca]|uniref:Protein phosphatase 1 regulatory subunit 15A/B C-terminal domain-containing protein n=1 Tax=Hyalella azteca TaxID=294128 RepID=A0A6A0HDC6_HYAAZ|nr:hypothetical protein HAZT_HAZT001283 [Hyalella azteca]
MELYGYPHYRSCSSRIAAEVRFCKPPRDVRAGLLDNLTTTTTKCNHPSLFSASTPLPLNTSYPPHHTTAPPHLTTPHQYQETTALDAGYCFVGLDDLPSSGLPCGPGQSGRSNNLLRKLSGAFRSMNQQATTWVNPSYVAGSSKSPRNQRYSFPSKQTYNSHSHTREAKPRHPHPNEMYQNKETVIAISHAFTVMEAPEARLNEGYRHPCSSHPKRRSPLAGNGVEKLNHINEMGSALNPDAQEWKGWIASSKLNPEAKEWIPGPITDNIVVNYQDKSEPTALPSPLDEEQMMKGITAARTNSSGDLEKAEKEASLDATKNEEPKHFLEDQNEATIDTNQSKQSVIGDKEVEMESPVRGDLNEVQEDAISRDRNVAHETENKCSEILANTSSVASCKSKRSPCWLFEKLRNMSFNPRKSYKNDVDSVTSCSGDEDDDCGVEFCDLDDDNVKDDDDGITFEEDDSEPAECDENDDSSSDDESGAESNDDCIEERESSTDDESYDECYSGSDTESDEVDFCAGFPSKLLSGTKPQVGPGSNTKPQVGPSSSVKLQVGPSSNPKPQDGPGSNPKPQDGPGSNPKPQVEPDSNAKPYRSPTQALCAMWRCQSNKPQPPPGLSFSDDDWESDGNSGSISASNWAFGEGLMTIKTPINTVCKMLGYVEKERKNSLTEVEKANLKWDTAINDDVRGHSGQKVSFNDSVSMCYVDIDVDRKGEWQQIGRDNERFRKRISGLCGILSPVLEAGHRNAVYNARFRENELGDEDLAENVAR